MNVETLPKLT